MRAFPFVLLSLSLSLGACTGAAGDRDADAQPSRYSPVSAAVRYDRIHKEAHASKRPVALCELVRIFDGGAGVYTVTGLTGRTERTPEGALDGFTYVELELVEAWTEDAPSRAVARIAGGPAGKGATRMFGMELSVGETLGVLLYAPREATRGYHGLDTLGLFQEDERGGFQNEQLFLDAPRSLQEIGGLVRENAAALAANTECPNEVVPFANRANREFPAPGGQPTKPVKIVLGPAEGQ